MDLLEGVENLLASVRVYAEMVDEDIADRKNDPRSMCFWNIHNRVKVTQEILAFYAASWPDDPEGEGEMLERVMTVTRDMFVDAVSSIEKASKDAVGIYSGSGIREKSLEVNRFLYLRTIIKASADLGYVEPRTMEDWDNLLVIRNLAVHNNSVSDRSKKFELAGVQISMRPGRMMKGPVGTFIALTDTAVTLFYRWLEAVHLKAA
ncbi:MAG: hypothetical protein GX224_04330 [Thermoplasmatales archaeon]|nr:hypothetical protein [Thermoplasmatales archaeon]